MSILQSESTQNVVLALFNASSEVQAAHKNADNPYFNSSYADLRSVTDAFKDPIRNHGLQVLQFPVPTEKPNHAAVETRIIHVESGEYIGSLTEIPMGKADPQAYGSAVTYARRYSLMTMLGIVTTDDDANAAMGHAEQQPHQGAPQQQPQNPPPQQPMQQPHQPMPPQGNAYTPPQPQQRQQPPQSYGQPQMNMNGSEQEFPQLSGVQFHSYVGQDGSLRWIAHGDTRSHVDVLKRYGFNFDRSTKVWWKFGRAA